MREQRAAAGYFPFYRITQRGQIDLGNYQPALSGKMLIERALQLISGGQVDIAIGKIDRRTVEDAIGLKLRPLIGGQDFIRGGGAGGIGHSSPMPKPRRAGKRYGTPPRLGRFQL
jgi:hypothetical protein